jgi:ubiquitin carboxyl-terminal hydrolase 16
MATEIINRLIVKFTNKNGTLDPIPKTKFIPTIFGNFFRYFQNNWHRPKLILSVLAITTSIYIFDPIKIVLNLFKIERTQTESTSRPDKYTTGFINTGNDCFANSTVQSLVPLNRLNEYFYKIINYELPPEAIKYPLPLHLAMFQLLNKLRELKYTKFQLSVWDLLHLLEQIHQGKVSRSQHDAHELFQMLIETLEDEYNRFFSFFLKIDHQHRLEFVEQPQFPFSSIIESKLRCLTCNYTSSPVKNAMMILELIVPQSSNVTLETIVKNNQNEIIEEYSCLVCISKNIILQMSNLKLTNEQIQFVYQLKANLLSGTLLINDDLREDPLFKSIIANNASLQNSKLKSTVHKEVAFTEAPDILPVHLSRSIFENAQTWRNLCTVSFDSTLEIKTSKGLPVIYELRSVIRHQGSHSSGHYECYRRKPEFLKTESGKYSINIFNNNMKKYAGKKKKKLASVLNKPFWRISDGKITEVNTNCVLNDGKAAYMLVYERI